MSANNDEDPPSKLQLISRLPAAELQAWASTATELLLDSHHDVLLHPTVFAPLTFPALRTLCIDASDLNTPASMASYLSPTLTSFELFGGYLSDAFLLTLATSCPDLQTFLLDNPRESITAPGLLAFFQSAPNLTKITIKHGLEDVVTPEVFAHLATRPTLLSYEGCMASVLTPAYVAECGGPEGWFPALEILTISATLAGWEALGTCRSRLRELHIDPVGESRGLLPSVVAACPALKELEVMYGIPPEAVGWDKDEDEDEDEDEEGASLVVGAVTPAELRMLSRLEKLELEIWSEQEEEEEEESVDRADQMIADADVLALLDACPGLTTLVLGVTTAVGTDILAKIAETKGARKIEKLYLTGASGIACLEPATAVLFPELKELTVYGLGWGANADVGKAVNILRSVAPKLDRVNLEDEFDRLLQKAWRAAADVEA